jgi:hypothetical protein
MPELLSENLSAEDVRQMTSRISLALHKVRDTRIRRTNTLI